jgi:photosystem II stability/assembly factor-like uncharacterized protein
MRTSAKKTLVSLVALLIALITTSQALATGWDKIASFPVIINNVFFMDQLTGFVGTGAPPGGSLGGTAMIFKTTDGGVTWVQATTPVVCKGCVTKIIMRDNMHGWASMIPEGCASQCSLWSTSDGGLTWSETSDQGSGTSVYQTSSALMVSDLFNSGGVSVDGGNTFVATLPSGTNGIDFVDDQHGVATVYRGQQWLSTSDGGKNWSPLTMNIESWSVYGVKNTSNYYAAPEGPTDGSPYQPQVLRSTDFGATWNRTATLPFVTTGTLVGVGDAALYLQVCGNCTAAYSGIYRSIDQGASWQSIGGPSTNGDTRFSVAGDPCFGNIVVYAFDIDGNLYKYLDKNSSSAGTVTIYPDGKKVVKPMTAVTIPTNVALPSSSKASTLQVTSVEYSLLFNSDILDIPTSKLASSIIPPTGWTFDKASISTNLLRVSITNPSKLSIADSLPLGSVTFNVYSALAKSTLVNLGSLTLHTMTGDLTYCRNIEGDFIANVVLDQSAVSITQPMLESFSISPNPVSQNSMELSFSTPLERELSITIYDVMGKEVYSLDPDANLRTSGTHHLTISTASLRNGVYYVRFATTNGVQTQKVSVLR